MRLSVKYIICKTNLEQSERKNNVGNKALAKRNSISARHNIIFDLFKFLLASNFVAQQCGLWQFSRESIALFI